MKIVRNDVCTWEKLFIFVGLYHLWFMNQVVFSQIFLLNYSSKWIEVDSYTHPPHGRSDLISESPGTAAAIRMSLFKF